MTEDKIGKIMKRVVIRAMALMICLIFMTGITVYAEEPQINNNMTTFKFHSEYGDLFIRLENDFDFIHTGSNVINYNLALTAVVLSDRIYNGTDAEDVLKGLGYTYTDTTEPLGSTSNIAFCPVASMGYKHLINSDDEESNVFAIVIRGTQDISVDWATDLYDGGISMFDASRGNVVAAFKQFAEKATGKTIKELKNEENYFFITGHSLGGATANALSVDSTVTELASGDKSRIYTYTFESPHTCIDLWWMRVANMSNAFNFKDNDDFITHISPVMGATTYGKDISFDVNILDNEIFKTIFPHAKGGSVTEAPKVKNYGNPFGHHDRGLDLIYILQMGIATGLWEQTDLRVTTDVENNIILDMNNILKKLNVPADAEEFEGHYYKAYNTALDWEEAKKKCEEMGGHLATITSKEEQNFIEKIPHNNSWIGGHRINGQWEWVTGEKFNYTYWGSGEPNNSSNVIPDENCIAVWPDYWNDLNEKSREQSGFICEWE